MKTFINKIFSSRWWLLPLLLLIVFVNWAATKWHTRADLTAEHRFTLGYSTKKMLRNLREPITVNIFLAGNLPSGFKNLAASTNDVLQEFKEVAGTKLRYKFIDPSTSVPGTEVTYSDSLTNEGLIPLNLTSQLKEGQQQQLLFPYGHVTAENKSVPVTLYKGKTPAVSFKELSSAEAMLEYNLASAIEKASEAQPPIVAYATGNGEPQDITTYDMVQNVLEPNYKLFTFNLNTQSLIPKEFNVLLLVKPKSKFTEEEKFKLDQFVMNGGKLLLFIDKLNAELDSLQKGEVVAYDRDLKLDDQLFKYGVRINPDLLMDLNCDVLPFDVSGNGQFELLPWNYFPAMEAPKNSIVTKNLGFVSGRFVNSIDTIENPGIKKFILLQSSANARTIGTPAIISGKENETAPQSAKYNRSGIPTAVLLEGKFQSLYKNRVMQWMQDSLLQNNSVYVPENIQPNKMIIVGDGDVVLNSILKGQPIPMGMNPYTYGTQREFPFANKEFLISCLQYLTDRSGLSDAKGKDYVARLLDTKKVEEQKTLWQVINIILPILLILLAGIIYNIVRRKKYRVHNG